MGDSSVYHAVVIGVPSYGHHMQEVECANHAIKCYWNHLEKLCRSHPEYQRQYGLSAVRLKRITHGAHCAINYKMHSSTGDVAELRHELQNGIQYDFGDH